MRIAKLLPTFTAALLVFVIGSGIAEAQRGRKEAKPDPMFPNATREEPKVNPSQRLGKQLQRLVDLNEEESAATVFVFDVCTKAMPDGFPVPVMLTDEGPKIDWEAFIAFNDDHFQKLLTGPADQSGIFNLLVKPEVGAEPSPYWFRYRLRVPMPGREATGWVRKDSVALAALRAVFEGQNGYNKESVDGFVSGKGVPLRVAVTKRRTNDGQEFLEIVDLVAVSWGAPKRD